MFESWASATRDSASARTSSCSRTTIRGELGSLNLSLAISSVIFCLPGIDIGKYYTANISARVLTIPTRLNRSLNVSDTLDSDSELVVMVDIHILELSNLVK